MLAALILAEVGARLLEGFRSSTREVPFGITSEEWQSRYELDPAFGFRPRFDTDIYDEIGVRRNDYALSKSPERTRVLFLGDSVTQRARIIEALRDAYGEERFEYWNGGVESFSLIQTVNYFLRYTSACDPDHVVLTFHYNDFQTTPVTFLNEDGEPVLYAPPRSEVIGWLYERSSLYRRIIKTLDGRAGEEPLIAEMRDALNLLRTWCEGNDARCTVLFHPFLRREDFWYDTHYNARSWARQLCRDAGLRLFDLTEPLRDAHERGIEIPEAPADFEHPSDALAEVFADYLRRAGLFELDR